MAQRGAGAAGPACRGRPPHLTVIRYLVAQGIVSHVVDSASIEVNRRRRRAKSDRLDVGKLLFQLVRYMAGERKVWSVVHVPTEAAEDRRQALVVERVRQLLRLRGIGINSAWLYVMEFFGWRAFRNRREVGALAGLTPTPYQSGESSREQGIAKAGNRYIRAMAIEDRVGMVAVSAGEPVEPMVRGALRPGQ